ncbi:Glycosyl transferases group 1 [Mariprofundus ferrinatatus]|uniref:Glycosyl transferases group 1 n=1 Tax=Mariprofundus ferrinatatus TaxID=1921087 RepID=A0A2K8LAP5_9PROT|nr:glycosyltransferase family 4 protein [Mariprofundus ferrinatatus]ATX82971.1 Glycosyl transferases group 1 [Mariprofundus ferrinatatus]
MSRILHIAAHMGGGVGRALSGLLIDAKQQSLHEHHLVCLEKPEKQQFLDPLVHAGCKVTTAPDEKSLRLLITDADIVQLEFWNHPTLLRYICGEPLPPARVVVWCHTSGLHFPVIPAGLVDLCHRFVMTSACSLQAENISQLDAEVQRKLAVISSAAGMEQMPAIRRKSRTSLRAGYLGTLNFSKLHPDYISLLASVDDPTFSVRMVGDVANREILERRCREVGRPALLNVAGYSTNVTAELAEMDLFLYLLNPTHYGTAEIALLEAMALGVVPIVLDHPCEREIVEDGVNGFVVHDGNELAERIAWIQENDEVRLEMAVRAAKDVRERFSFPHQRESFTALYEEVIMMPKQRFDYREAFGATPAEWFHAFVADSAIYSDDGSIALPQGYLRHAMLEQKKGSVFHFASAFPEDAQLESWRHATEKRLQ